MTCPGRIAVKLTTTAVKRLALPPGVIDKTFFDDTLPGFGLRLRAGGSRAWVVQYDIKGRTRRMSLGSTATLDLGEARKRARDVLAARTLGRDPASEKQETRARAAKTFGVLLFQHYLPFKRKELRPRSFKEVERHLVNYARVLHSRPITSITRGDISSLVREVAAKAGPTAANAACSSLSGFFGWLIRDGMLDGENPASYVNKAIENKPRDRVPTPAELREIWYALGNDDYGDIVRLLIYTGARRSEIGGLRGEEIDFDAAIIEVPAERMKNNRPHLVPLSEPALTILRKRNRGDRECVFGRDGTTGFQSWARCRRALDAAMAGLRPDWVLHDLRRLVSTTMHDKLGIPPHIVEAVLAHVGHRSGVAGVYNKAEYLDEKRRALQRWAEYVDAVVTGKPAKTQVVQLRKRRG
jgi:integrase